MIRLVATDMDGTFLTSERKLLPKNVEMVHRLLESGIVFCLASGRGISTIEPFWQELGIKGPTVSSNGAFVIDHIGTTIANHSLPENILSQLIEYARTHSIHVNLYSGDDIFFSQEGKFADLYRIRTGCFPTIQTLDELNSRSATKLLFVDHPDRIIHHTKATAEILAGTNIAVVVSEPDYLEFLPIGINKGIGLARLAESLCISQSEVAAIGDWTNDLEMLVWAEFSACVSNAAPEIKAVAQRMYSSNDEGGFAEFAQDVLKLNMRGIISE
ncbi:MAG: HAD family phosphatase [Fimbriimonadaceae bacterium]|nr:MAG: HAD family phosphatase [Fimbriimonadaceae bacterium]